MLLGWMLRLLVLAVFALLVRLLLTSLRGNPATPGPRRRTRDRRDDNDFQRAHTRALSNANWEDRESRRNLNAF